MSRQIVVLPSLQVKGWDGTDFDGVSVYPRSTWEDFASPQPSDAMAVTYLVPGDDVQPRLNAAALDTLASLGQTPEVHWVFLDFDRPGHEPWPDPAQAALALYSALDRVTIPGGGGYTTRAGLRLVWALSTPLPATLANSFLEAFLAEVADALPDLEPDPVSARWTQLFRTPLAARDGVPADPTRVFIQEPGQAVDPYDLAEARGWALTSEAGSAAARVSDRPSSPVDLSFEQWKAAWAHPGLKVGTPIPEEGGHRYPRLRSILASIAKAGDITDPLVLVSYVWDSVENTPGLTLDDAWRLASWVAAQQEQDQERRATVDTSQPPEAPEPPSLEEWAEIRRYFRGRDRRYYEKLADGIALNHQASRLHETTWHVIRVLAEKAQVPSAADIYAFVWPSVQAAAPDGPRPEEVWEKCHQAVKAATLGDDNEAARVIFCQDYPLTIKQVGKGGALFQLDTTAQPYCYRRTDSQSIYLHFDQYTRPNLPFEAEYATTMDMAQILRGYGRTVEKVVYTSGQEGTVYDRAADYISQGVHTLQAHTPRYHEEVDTYLRMLGASDPEAFLDWCAAVTYTASENLAALYIKGPPGAGKSLLAAGLASLWGTNAADYNQVQGDFNGALLDSPILHADEGVSPDPHNEAQAADKFRNYVANSQHAINAKYAQPAFLQAALRVLITCNDDHGLPFKKALGQDGIDAIVQRVLYLEADPATPDYLNSLGGRGGLRDWVKPNGQPGVFAEHLLWLKENRELKGGGRFLVEGKPTAWHRSFAADQGYKPAVLTVIATLTGHVNADRGQEVAVRPDPEEGVIWVHHSAVYEHWKYTDVRRPKPALVKETVAMLAGPGRKQYRIGGKPKWLIPIPFSAFVDSAVLEWGDHGFTEPEDA